MKAEQLRKSILQLAIQGKLVKQDPNDEPASVLLERIRAEKQRLIKEGKIKKDKGDSIIFKGDDNCYYEKIGSEVKNINDKIPFEIPDSWCWIRLGDLLEIARGGSPRPIKEYLTTAADGVNWIKIGDTEKGGKYINTTKEKIKSSGVSKSRFVHKGDFLLTNSMSFGRPYILNVDGCIHDGWLVFSDTFCVFHKEFLYYVLSSPFAFMQFIGKVSGAVVKNLNSEKVADSIFPLPPLAEQKRIVKEIERFEPLLADYDKLEQQATKLDNEIYDKLKKSILQHAIQGNLVEQNENDEPASVLLERIRAEKKAQLGKKYIESYIYKGDDNCYYEHIGGKDINITEEIPFDLPNGWEWTRLKNVINSLTDGTHSTPKYTASGVPFISVKDVSSGKLSFENTKFISYEEHSELTKRCKPQRGDILLTKVGTTGIPVLIDSDIEFSLFVSVALIKFNAVNILPEYFIYLLKSPLVQEQAAENTRGVGNKNWVLSDIEKTLLVLPPLAEQKRIVNKINEIFSKL